MKNIKLIKLEDTEGNYDLCLAVDKKDMQLAVKTIKRVLEETEDYTDYDIFDALDEEGIDYLVVGEVADVVIRW